MYNVEICKCALQLVTTDFFFNAQFYRVCLLDDFMFDNKLFIRFNQYFIHDDQINVRFVCVCDSLTGYAYSVFYRTSFGCNLYSNFRTFSLFKSK